MQFFKFYMFLLTVISKDHNIKKNPKGQNPRELLSVVIGIYIKITDLSRNVL